MTAEILTIGDEILIGQITNTNTVWIAQQLNKAGISVLHMATVADDERAIKNALRDANGRADFVFITGGLGPTNDDITRKVFAEYLGCTLVEHAQTVENLENYFRSRGRQLNSMNRQMALVPEGCVVIGNKNGTAPGMWMQKDKTVFISMPGVPYEMTAMMTEAVLPKIRSEYVLPHIYHKTVLTQGIGESAIAEIIHGWEDALAEKKIRLAYLPQTGTVRLRLSSSGKDEAALKKSVEDSVLGLQKLIGEYIYGYEEYGGESPTPEKIVSDLLRERNATVSLAESCTGGYISSLITAIPGSSAIFRGAIIPYTNAAKHDLLQVDKKIFDTVGAVSRDCVEQLATNVRERLGSDYAISVSGIAGPTGGTSQKPVGTVWIAVANREKVYAKKFRFGDNRQRNIIMSANAAMILLRKLILEQL
jgi:nicotinamide-nucleotide amidase